PRGGFARRVYRAARSVAWPPRAAQRAADAAGGRQGDVRVDRTTAARHRFRADHAAHRRTGALRGLVPPLLSGALSSAWAAVWGGAHRRDAKLAAVFALIA